MTKAQQLPGKVKKMYQHAQTNRNKKFSGIVSDGIDFDSTIRDGIENDQQMSAMAYRNRKIS